jgi:NAD(P)H-hydrate epimerase
MKMREPSITCHQVRVLDRWAVDALGLPSLVLMENAGRNAADVAGFLLEDADKARVAVLAGAGNNGGDGFVVARHLCVRDVFVTVFLLAGREKIVGDAKINLDALDRLGVKIHDATGESPQALTERWRRYSLLVDALGGTGITGPLRGDVLTAVQAANDTGQPILALDIPTGLNGDTGLADGPAIGAVATITFAARKTGFDNPDSEPFTGEVIVGDIGIPAVLMPEQEKGD